MHVAVMLATLVIGVTSSNMTASPILHPKSPSFSFPVFVLQNVVVPPRNALLVKAVTPNFHIAKYYGDVLTPTLRCKSSTIPQIFKAKKNVKVTTEVASIPPMASVLIDSVSDDRHFALNTTVSPALRSDFHLGSFLDTTFIVSYFVFVINTAIVLLITLLLELNLIDENDLDHTIDVPSVPKQTRPKRSVTFNVPARKLRTADATMNKAIQVQLNLDVCSVPVICLPKLRTLFDNEKLDQRVVELNNKVVSPNLLERLPVTGAFNAPVISDVRKSIEKRVHRINAMKNKVRTNVKQTVVAVRNITRTTKQAQNSSDC